MILEWIRFVLAAGCLLLGLVFMILSVFGVNRLRYALNRMHAAAMGDTLGILFVILGLMILRGFSMDSLKLLLVILFFWMASPVSGHMISRLEAMTNKELGEIHVILVPGKDGGALSKEKLSDEKEGNAAAERKLSEEREAAENENI